MSTPTTNDPTEIALEAEAAGAPPSGVAHEVLAKQSRLLDAQIDLARQEKLRNRARGAAFAAAVALVLGAAGWIVFDASRASGIVIRPFDTTPALTAQGLSGEAVANDLLGRLAAIQATTDSARTERRASGAGDEVSVEIAQTGISVGEVLRLLRARFGHEDAISGSLRPGPDGQLTVSVRVNGRQVAVPPAPTPGTTDALIGAAAEAVMRETDGYRYARWLAQQGRQEESVALHRRLTQVGSPTDRAWSWSALSAGFIATGRPQEAVAAARTAHALDPRQPTATVNLRAAEETMGHAEAAFAAGLEGVRTLPRDSVNTWGARWGVAFLRKDFRAVMQLQRERSAQEITATDGRGLQLNLAQALAAMHESAAARATLAAVTAPPFRPMLGTGGLSLALAPAIAVEDWTAAETLLSQPWTLAAAATGVAADEGAAVWWDRTFRWPWQAYLAARAGRFEDAERLIGQTPSDCYLCVRMRGQIAALKGDAAASDRWFAEAVRQAPSVADADLEWGRAKLARGDAAGALALFDQATKKAPGWADPRKYAGDALVRLGKPKAALARYADAAERAPRWGGLHLSHGLALARLGRAEDARARFAAAAAMDLTPSEKAELARVRR